MAEAAAAVRGARDFKYVKDVSPLGLSCAAGPAGPSLTGCCCCSPNNEWSQAFLLFTAPVAVAVHAGGVAPPPSTTHPPGGGGVGQLLKDTVMPPADGEGDNTMAQGSSRTQAPYLVVITPLLLVAVVKATAQTCLACPRFCIVINPIVYAAVLTSETCSKHNMLLCATLAGGDGGDGGGLTSPAAPEVAARSAHGYSGAGIGRVEARASDAAAAGLGAGQRRLGKAWSADAHGVAGAAAGGGGVEGATDQAGQGVEVGSVLRTPGHHARLQQLCD